MTSVARKWFGSRFSELHPELQKLHTHGGVLSGEVQVQYGTGVGGLLGKRLGKKLGLPPGAGPTTLKVVISHTDEAMIWSRQFGGASKAMVSEFTPQGFCGNGYWSETTSGITIELAVDIKQGAWHWVQRATKINNITVPAAVLPIVNAHKTIIDELYHFEVEITKPVLGLLVRYKGALAGTVNAPTDA